MKLSTTHFSLYAGQTIGMILSKMFIFVPGFLFSGIFTFGQNSDEGHYSPGGYFDRVFDRFGEEIELSKLAIRTGETATYEDCTAGFFKLHFEEDCGMEGTNLDNVARRDVACKVFSDLSEFIISPLDGQANTFVHIWIRDITVSVPDAAISGVLGNASAYYVAAPNSGGIIDNQIWQTIHSGIDAYTNVASSLFVDPESGAYYHGKMAFNFVNPDFTWHSDLSSNAVAGTYDLYSVLLHEAIHALGFASLINYDGTSRLPSGFEYFNRYDAFLETQADMSLLAPANLTCSMYQQNFEPNISVITPGCNFDPPVVLGSSDNTNCPDALRFDGSSILVPIYTPQCYEAGSSLSHFEDMCYQSYQNNQYFVMSNALGTGPLYTKRHPTNEERLALCDIGYNTESTFGQIGDFYYYDEYTGTCNGSDVAGINDGIVNGTYQYTPSIGSQLNLFPLINDYNATSLECPEIVLGTGLVLDDDPFDNAFTYTPYTPGLHLLRYIPLNNDAERGNITYIFIYVVDGLCEPDICNLVNNGDFEAATNSGPFNQGTTLNCWDALAGTPDVFMRNGDAAYDIPESTGGSDPGSETWSGNNSGNDNFMGLHAIQGLDLGSEVASNFLSSPLMPGNSYVLRFRAKVNNDVNNFASDSNVPASVLFCSGAVPNVSLGTVLYEPVTDWVDDALEIYMQIVPQTTENSSTGDWYEYQYEFQFNGDVPHNILYVSYDIFELEPLDPWRMLYFFIDDISIVQVDQYQFDIPEMEICTGPIIEDLEQYVNVPGGVFSGPGVYELNGNYFFDPSLAGPGTHVIQYEFTNNLGCNLSISDEVVVGNFDLLSATYITSEVLCFGVENPVEVTVTGGVQPYTFDWQGPTISSEEDPTNLLAGDYILTVSDANMCEIELEITITQPDELVTAHVAEINTPCSEVCDGLLSASASGGTPPYTYEWDAGYTDATIENVCPGEYSLTVTDANGCQDLSSVTVLVGDFYGNDPIIYIEDQATSESYEDDWSDNTQLIANDIIVGNGSDFIEMTITNGVFLLGPNVDIIINENAVVNFIHCTFSSCQNWNGFDVRSNSANGIPPGELRFDHTGTQSSEIRNAMIAIETRDERPNVYLIPFYQRRAGVLECRRTIFRDNKSALRITDAYQSPYQVNPHFSRCTFTVTDELADHFVDNLGEYNQFRQHVSFNSVYKYNFSGCVFRNEMTDNPDILIARWQNRGIGIASRNSMFNIDRAFQNGQTIFGRFEGLDRGISASGSKLRVSNQVFQENHIGALMTTSGASRFFTNTFHIGLATDIDYLDEQEYYGSYPNIGGNSWSLGEDPFTSYEGLVIYKGDLTEVAENNFIGYPQANDGISDTWARIGTRIRATNTQEMVVYNNNYTRLSYGNLANADNAGGTGTSGLRYICNTNTLNWQDFTNIDFLGTTGPVDAAVIGNLQLEPAETFEDQEEPWPAGNTFSTDNASTATHFRNEGVEIDQYWHAVVASETPTDFIGIDQDVTTIGVSHDCPNIYGLGAVIHSQGDIQQLLLQSSISQADADQLLYLYLLLLDDGNTEDLKIFVEDTWGEQVWLTRDYLLDISPFVSNTVLLEVLDNTTVYPHALAFEILMANPTSLDNPVLMDYLSTKSEPMPSYMIDLLLAYEPGSTPRTELEINLAASRTKHISNASRAMWAMMDYDDDTYSKADIDGVLGKVPNLNTEMMIVEDMLHDGLAADAIDRAENIPNTITLIKNEPAEWQNFMIWVNLRADMLDGSRDWETMNASDLATLQNLVLKFDSYAGVLAMDALNEYTGTDYFVPPAFGGNSSVKRATSSATELSVQLLDIYPNPADFITTIRIKEMLPTTQLCQLVVFDILGKEISTTTFNPMLRQVSINTKQWAEGFYLFKITMPNSQLQLNGKFEIIH